MWLGPQGKNNNNAPWKSLLEKRMISMFNRFLLETQSSNSIRLPTTHVISLLWVQARIYLCDHLDFYGVVTVILVKTAQHTNGQRSSLQMLPSTRAHPIVVGWAKKAENLHTPVNDHIGTRTFRAVSSHTQGDLGFAICSNTRSCETKSYVAFDRSFSVLESPKDFSSSSFSPEFSEAAKEVTEMPIYYVKCRQLLVMCAGKFCQRRWLSGAQCL